MATMTIRLPEAKHERLRRLAERHGISLTKLEDEWATMALAQFDAETRFLVRVAHGYAQQGLALLDKLDQGARRRANKKAA